jgi:hypothetical protein
MIPQSDKSMIVQSDNIHTKQLKQVSRLFDNNRGILFECLYVSPNADTIRGWV